MRTPPGPISITGPGRAVWMIGGLPGGLGEEVAATGGLLRAADADPLAELVRVQRLAVARLLHVIRAGGRRDRSRG